MTEPIAADVFSSYADISESEDGGEPISLAKAEETVFRADDAVIDDTSLTPDAAQAEEATTAAEEETVTAGYKAYVGEDFVDVPADAEFDFEGEKVSIKELIDLKTNVRSRYGELGRKEQQVTQQTEELQKNLETYQAFVGELAKASESGDPEAVINQAISVTGQNPVAFWQNLYEKIAPKMEEFLNMDDVQRRAINLEQENEYLRKQQEQASQQDMSHKQLQEQQQAVMERAKQAGVEPEELDAAYKDKFPEYQTGKHKNLSAAERESIVQTSIAHAQQIKLSAGLETLIEEISPGSEHREALAKRLTAEIMNPYREYEVTEEGLRQEIKEILDGVNGSAAAPNGAPAKTSAAEDEVEVLSQEQHPVGDDSPTLNIFTDY